MKIPDQNSIVDQTCFVGQVSWYEWQWWVFEKARENGWAAKIPSVLGTCAADIAFKEAEIFLLTKGILSERK